MPIEVPNRDEWFPIASGLPQPDWLAINEWLGNVVPPDHRDLALEQLTRHWLARLVDALGGAHTLHETKSFFLLSTRDVAGNKATIEMLDKTRDHVLATLGKAAGIKDTRKLIILRLTNEDATWAVWASIQPESPEAVEFFSTGSWPVIFCEGHRPTGDYWRLVGSTVDHLLGYLPMPAWLYYSLGSALRVDLLGGRFATLDEELFDLHNHCWNAQSIQDFWSGKAFGDRDWGNLSYNLACVFLDILRRELHPDYVKLQRFIQTASRADGGEAAAQRFFGVSLGEIAAVFLGDAANWTPRPATWRKEENE